MLIFSKPAVLLRIEALCALVIILFIYWNCQASWLLFAILFFVPDVSIFGYLASVRTGTILYNIFHTSSFAAILALLGWFANNETCLSIGLIWAAHIAFDRMLGFGLKLPDGFNHTHLGMMGKKQS